MSAFIALNNAVLGLKAQSQALENISGNIANSQTIGFKRVETAFAELVGGSSIAGQERAGGVSSFSRGTTPIAGAINATGVATNFALSGPGLAIVRQPADANGNEPVFAQTNLYTRRGDFDLDQHGYLINGTGQALCGYEIDPVSGARSTGQPEVLRLTVGLCPAQPSTRLAYSGNLPAIAQTSDYASGVSTTDVWTAGASGPDLVSPSTTPTTASLTANSISGQSVRLYTSVGQAKDVELRWAKLTAGPAAQWGLYYNSTPTAAAGAETWKKATTATFNASGKLTAPAAAVSVNLSDLGLGSISLDLTGGKLTQFADPAGEARISNLVQDGFAAGTLNGVSVGESGRITANFSNGQLREIAQIAIAQFSAPGGLVMDGSGAWRESAESGAPILRSDGMSFAGGSVEGSNTDVAQEFSKLIVTQQAYSANTRVMSTAQQMLQDVLNVVR